MLNENFWFYFDPLGTPPLRKVINIPKDIRNLLACLVYFCLAAASKVSAVPKGKKKIGSGKRKVCKTTKLITNSV